MIHIPLSNMWRSARRPAVILAAAWVLNACAPLQQKPVAPDTLPAAQTTSSTQACPAPATACAACNCEKPSEAPPKPVWQKVDWPQLPGWAGDSHEEAWKAFLASCAVLKRQPAWRSTCEAAERQPPAAARMFFENQLMPWHRVDANGTPPTGLFTGYYEPLLSGSRSRRAPNLYPVYGVPDDLLVIDLGELRPDLKGQRLRGRVEGRRVIPYFSRAELEAGRGAVNGHELLFVDDPIDLFFLMIQGSGRVKLDNGQTVRLNYADQNGHPYRSIGRLLVDRGELKLEQASMQGIKNWARANPGKLAELLNANPSYVFFRETGTSTGALAELPGPLGAQGLALTPGRSLAVDSTYYHLGSPVWLATTWPNTERSLQRLMLAQDTGGAIRGANRGDFFWGFGDEAGREAGRMRQSGEIWLLWPTAAGEPPP
jgi:membrane-bound lytic murein transglycosylase A